jgi:hypothetical protein
LGEVPSGFLGAEAGRGVVTQVEEDLAEGEGHLGGQPGERGG